MLFDQVSDIKEALMFDPTTLPACVQEDGSTPGQALPCYWDAAVAGNGTGTSFVIPAPSDQLAHTGIDPLMGVVAALMVIVGIVAKVVTR